MRRLHTTWAPRRLIALVVTGLVVGSGLAVGAPAATAAGDFYTPPAQFDTDPGAVIRSEPSPLLLQIPGVPNQWPGTATRVMYTSSYQDGKPAAVTGTLVEPTAPWQRGGKRPTVVLGPGTVGQGDQCAGSKMMNFPLAIDPAKPSIAVNYTALELNLLLINGAVPGPNGGWVVICETNMVG